MLSIFCILIYLICINPILYVYPSCPCILCQCKYSSINIVTLYHHHSSIHELWAFLSHSAFSISFHPRLHSQWSRRSSVLHLSVLHLLYWLLLYGFNIWIVPRCLPHSEAGLVSIWYSLLTIHDGRLGVVRTTIWEWHTTVWRSISATVWGRPDHIFVIIYYFIVPVFGYLPFLHLPHDFIYIPILGFLDCPQVVDPFAHLPRLPTVVLQVGVHHL